MNILRKKLRSPAGLNYLQTFYLPFSFGLMQKIDLPEGQLSADADVLIRSAAIGRWLGLIAILSRIKNEQFYTKIVLAMLDMCELLQIDTIEFNVACYCLANSISAGFRRFGSPFFAEILPYRALKLIEKGSSSSFLPTSIILTTQSSTDEEFKNLSEIWLGELKNQNILSIRKGDVFSALAAACRSELCFVGEFSGEDSSMALNEFRRKICPVLVEFVKNSLLVLDYDPLILKPTLLSFGKLIHSTNYFNKNTIELPKNFSYLNEKSNLRQFTEIINEKNVS